LKKFGLKKKFFKKLLDFIARVAISLIFIRAIPNKVTSFSKNVEFISSKGIPDSVSPILLVGAIICLILGSGFFVFSENQKIGTIFLLIFLLPTTIIFHFSPFHQKAVLINLGLMGGLLISAIRDQK
tara:strand:+ start:114 stop:494 length:381 start_codon:yes stop_codon:yes gene_type:complete